MFEKSTQIMASFLFQGEAAIISRVLEGSTMFKNDPILLNIT